MLPFNNIQAELHPPSQFLEQFSGLLVAKELPYDLAGLEGVGTIILGFIESTMSELMEGQMKIKLESGDETESLLPDNESQEFAIE